MIRGRMIRILFAFAILCAGVVLEGCSKDPDRCLGCPTPPDYEQTTPDHVLRNISRTYIRKDVDIYPRQLAEDFRFYFEPQTRIAMHLPEFWNRFDDSTGTDLSMFKSDKIGDIRIALTYSLPAEPVTEPGRERWLRINALADIDVEQKPDQNFPEGITLRVSQRLQNFYFRKGRNPADTLATSHTANQFFIVEWREPALVSVMRPDGVAASENTTWSYLKTLYK